MVIQTTINGITAYLHAAYATDENGTDFSLTDFDGAVYVGNYTDTSATESTNYKRYAWQLIGNAEIDADEIEDYEELEPIEVAEVSDSLDSLDNTAGNLQAQIDENKADAVITQTSNDEGIGNVNMLAGTNQGVTGWTASANLTISAMNSPIYEETSDAVNFVRVTCDSAGSNYILFNASYLRSVLAELTDDNSFTFSADVRMSTVFEIGTVAVQDVDETNAQIEFDEITNEAIDEDTDNNGAWVHNISTSNVINDNAGDPIPESAQFLYFDLSQMGAGETLDIANLKIEAGAIATPWRASLDEVEATANAALNAANTVTNHFWYDANGAHITEATQADYIADPTNAGGNTLITSSGMDVRDGTDTLASFGTTSVIGKTEALRARTVLEANGMRMIWHKSDGTDQTLMQIAYGANGPFYTLGERAPGSTIGTISMAEGAVTTASEFAAHSEGESTTASGEGSHAEGGATTASGMFAHAEGGGTTSSGISSHAEGGYTTASGQAAHAEGGYTTASAQGAHAEGGYTTASGTGAHAEGEGTIAAGKAQHVAGRFNVEDTTPQDADDYGLYALIIGNGSDDNNRSNALTVDWSGNIDAGDFSGGDISAGNLTVADIDADAITGDSISVTGAISGDTLTTTGAATMANISAADITASGTITAAADPTSALEVATKQYVDNSGGGFEGTATLLENGTLTSSTVQRNLSDSIDNYKFISIVCIIGNFRGTLTVPVTLFKDSTSGYQVVTVRNGTTDTRYGFFRYNNATSINRYCTVNNGLNYQIYGIK